MTTNSLESLIKDIKKNKVKALKNLIRRREVEQCFVDFKTSSISDYTNKTSLENNDRRNLAKAISGFGNSEGGLLIWGIGTKGKGDFANKLEPVKSPEIFLSLINGSVSRLTIPPHNLVEGFIVRDKKRSKGYIVTIIPKFEGLPIQVVEGYKFYMRAGDSFVPVPHSILSGMFGRRPNPDIIIMFSVDKKSPIIKNNFIEFSFGIQIANNGRGIARDVFLNCYSFGPGEPSQIAYQINDSNFTAYNVFDVGLNLTAKPDFRMASEQRIQLLVYHCRFKPPFRRDLLFQFTTGADNQMPRKTEIRRSKKELEEMYDLYLKDNEFKFIDKLLKVS